MDGHDPAAKEGSEQKSGRGLLLEQQRKFEELRERRLQLQNAQESGKKEHKKKKRKRGGNGNEHLAASEKQPSVEADRPTENTAKFGSEHRHVFAVNTGTDAASRGGGGEDLSASQSSRDAAGAVGEGHLGMVPSTTSKSPSGVLVPSKTLEAPPQKKKRQKLHWGMAIKERWERKSNM